MKEPDCLPLYEDAEFYESEFQDRRNDLDFYLREAHKSERSVLELACGTGRIAIPMALEGRAVEGLDISEPMLKRARAKAAALGLKIPWHLADCRTFRLGRRFDLIIMVSNAVQHLQDDESVLALFARVQEHLKPSGRFIFDVMNPDARKLARSPDLRYRHKTFRQSTGEIIEVDARSRYIAQERLFKFDLFYSKEGWRDFLVKSVSLRCFFPSDIEKLCQEAGFSIESKIGDFDGRPFTNSAPRQVMVCRPSC